MLTLFKRGPYRIYGCDDGFYEIHNIQKSYKDSVRIEDFKTAKYLIDLAIKEKVPNANRTFFIQSLIKLTNNCKYKEVLLQLSMRSRNKRKR